MDDPFSPFLMIHSRFVRCPFFQRLQEDHFSHKKENLHSQQHDRTLELFERQTPCLQTPKEETTLHLLVLTERATGFICLAPFLLTTRDKFILASCFTRRRYLSLSWLLRRPFLLCRQNSRDETLYVPVVTRIPLSYLRWLAVFSCSPCRIMEMRGENVLP